MRCDPACETTKKIRKWTEEGGYVPEQFADRTLGCGSRPDLLLDPAFCVLFLFGADDPHRRLGSFDPTLERERPRHRLEGVDWTSRRDGRSGVTSSDWVGERDAGGGGGSIFLDRLGHDRQRLTDHLRDMRLLLLLGLLLLRDRRCGRSDPSSFHFDDPRRPFHLAEVVPRVSLAHPRPFLAQTDRPFGIERARRDPRGERSGHEPRVREYLGQSRSVGRVRAEDPRDQVDRFDGERVVFWEGVRVVADFPEEIGLEYKIGERRDRIRDALVNGFDVLCLERRTPDQERVPSNIVVVNFML